ncbi:MAG: ATP-binding protein [Campylobacterota bacterium]|nr:ATP-binding protein [Campylobacterota bacterium]
MEKDLFINSRNAFLDKVQASDYIQIDRVSTIYSSLKDSINKPIKMILLYGKPGTGKSMFLNKLYQDLKTSKKIFLYKTPILDEHEFYKLLAQNLFNVKYEGTLNYTQFMKIVELHVEDEVPVVLLDEAQLYSDLQMEKIRLLSDTRKIKFVLTLHKTQKEDLIAKEHFQTRIWETIELKNATKIELKMYIQKKLMKTNSYNTANMVTDKNVSLIYKLTNGNYRETNKLLYSIFDIYENYFQNNNLKISNSKKLSSKIIEMSAIHTGLIDA